MISSMIHTFRRAFSTLPASSPPPALPPLIQKTKEVSQTALAITTPSLLWPIQFASRLAINYHSTLTPLFEVLLKSAWKSEQEKILNQLKTALHTSDLNRTQKEMIFSLIHDVNHLQCCLNQQSNEQLLQWMANAENDKTLIRLRLEQAKHHRRCNPIKQLRNPECLVTSLFLTSQNRSNELDRSLTQTLAQDLNSLGFRASISEGESLCDRLQEVDAEKTLLLIPVKRHFSLSFLENRTIAAFMRALKPDNIPVWLDLSEGNIKTLPTYLSQRGSILKCKDRSYPEILQEICHRLDDSPADFSRVSIPPLSDAQVDQSSTPRLDPLTTDLHVISSQPDFEMTPWTLAKRFPHIWCSFPALHPQLIRNNLSKLSFDDHEQPSLTQFYQRVFECAIGDHATYTFSPRLSTNKEKTMTILGRAALHLTLSNRRRIESSDLEKIFTPEEQEAFNSLTCWDTIMHRSRETGLSSFSYLIFQEYLAAYTIAQLFQEAEKVSERLIQLKRLVSLPEHEFIWRFVAGHLIHQELALQHFFLFLASSINDSLYSQKLLSLCLIECAHPHYLSDYFQRLSSHCSTHGVINSWLLKDSREMLLKEPNLWLTLLSISAQNAIQETKIVPLKHARYGCFFMRSEQIQEQWIDQFESLALGYPNIILPLLKQAVSSHSCDNLRSTLIKAFGRIALASPSLSDLIVDKIYHDPSESVRADAVEALASVCEKYPDRGVHLLQQLALHDNHHWKIKGAAVKGLGHLHSSLYPKIFSTTRQLLTHEWPEEDFFMRNQHAREAALELLDLSHTPTQADAYALLEEIIANPKASKEVKAEALWKIYSEKRRDPLRAIAILRDLATLSHLVKDENLIFIELNKLSFIEPQATLKALQEIMKGANNSWSLKQAAKSLGQLGERFPDEVIACYYQLKDNPNIPSFNQEYIDHILLEMGSHSAEKIFPLIKEYIIQADEKSLWVAITALGLFGHIDPQFTFSQFSHLIEKQKQWYNKSRIADALGNFGLHFPLIAMELLINFLEDNDLTVSLDVSHALSLIHHHHPTPVQSLIGGRFHSTIKERCRAHFNALRISDRLVGVPDLSHDMIVDSHFKRLKEILALNLSISSEVIQDISASLSNQSSNDSRITLSALVRLLSTIKASDPLWANSLLQIIDKDLLERLSTSLALIHQRLNQK